MCYKFTAMENFFETADASHVRREKEKARELRQSQWWRNQLGGGVCYHCHKKFPKELLTMDHVVPIIRGGKSTKSNVVVCCKACNSKKKYFTPAELAMHALTTNLTSDSIES